MIETSAAAGAPETPLANGTTLGPLQEGHRLGLRCEALAARPAPLVGWYRNGKLLAASLSTDTDDNDDDDASASASGLFNVRSALAVTLSRAELAAPTFECRVETPALPAIVAQLVRVDLQVRPTKIQMTGLQPQTVQGTLVQVMCLVSGARPAANITWYNNTTPLEANQSSPTAVRSISSKQEPRQDGTWSTLSKLVFTATRWENGMTVRCEGANVVTRSSSVGDGDGDGAEELLVKPVRQSYRMEVTCKCVMWADE